MSLSASFSSSNSHFADFSQNFADGDDDIDEETHLSAKAIQTRVNQLTRELHSLDESIRNQRMLGRKKDRLSTGSESVLISASQQSSTKKKAAKGHGQTGIESFFSASKPKTSSKKRGNEVLDLCGSDPEENVSKKRDSIGSSSDSDVEVVSPPNQEAAAKRDESDEVEVVNPPKQKTSPFEGVKQAESDESSEVEVLPLLPPKQDDGAAKRKESHSPEACGSPEKRSKLV